MAVPTIASVADRKLKNSALLFVNPALKQNAKVSDLLRYFVEHYSQRRGYAERHADQIRRSNHHSIYQIVHTVSNLVQVP